ncbi:MAG: amylo-alpha-1,6-glucosidase [Candidatus Bathyarchaeota archaeon]|nr:amylo-alpha-1,6-glucosidase [Candidatus Bathyarchaeota archaeon]
MQLPSIQLTQEALSHFDEALQKEWLVTNGLGGYAASTVLGVNTRKYHGLLIAALHPPGNRTVCLAKLDEEICADNNVHHLGANEFHDVIFPQGYRFLKKFSVSPFPQYVYHVHDTEVAKTVFMPSRRNAVAVVYSVLSRSASEVTFRVYPLLTCRHFHLIVDKNRSPLSFSQQQRGREFEVAFSRPRVTVAALATEGRFVEKPNWIERLYYREEDKRGESSIDDCYQPGYFEVTVSPRQKFKFAVAAAAGESSRETEEALEAIGVTTRDVENSLEQELKQRRGVLLNFHSTYKQVPANNWLSWLILGTNDFVVRGVGDRVSVIAGYFWFETWGRDTFISLPGLTLVTGRFAEARKILLEFQRHCKQGLVPNCLEDQCTVPSYNTVDATLWYINAVLQYLKYTGDFQFVQQQLWANLKEIVKSHEEGAAFGIRVDSDGLLVHGERLTWMDAEVNGMAVTPRGGKAVEIQALWYNALRIMQLLAGRFKEERSAEHYAEVAAKAQVSFNLKFWNAGARCLFDVVSESGVDDALRPNQIIAAALDFNMLDETKSMQVVYAVQRELLTPFGLRTLARNAPQYRGMYVGSRRSRDLAYHNGTVWAWLLGPYVTAFGKVKPSGTGELKALLSSLFAQQVTEAGLGTISEVFDGDPPHTPRGCVAQAWSVAEPLRAYVEDVLQAKPTYEKEVLQV